jgi:hypothetical protein
MTLPTFTTKFQQIVNKYSSIIVGQLYGHTHQDSFRLFRDGEKVTNVAYITPAATSWTNQHPSVRLFKFDKTTFELLDMLTFYANLTEANLQNKMTWRLEYSATQEYQMKDMSPESWQGVLHRMQVDLDYWLKFEKFFHVSYHIECPSGDDKCRKQQLCAISHQNYHEYMQCWSGK